MIKLNGESFHAKIDEQIVFSQLDYNDFVRALLEDDLEAKGIPAGHIRKYGFAFEGKNVLIGRAETIKSCRYQYKQQTVQSCIEADDVKCKW